MATMLLTFGAVNAQNHIMTYDGTSSGGHGHKTVCGAQPITAPWSNACSFCILTSRRTFVYLTSRTTDTSPCRKPFVSKN